MLSNSPISGSTRVLLVEDDEDDYVIARDMLKDIEGHYFVLDWSSSYDDAYQRMLKNDHDICLVDYRLGGRTGMDLMRDAILAGCRSAIIFLTGQSDHDVDQEAIRAGASDYLVKYKINADVLDRCIRYAIDRKQSEIALRNERNFIAAVIDSAGALVVVLDRRGKIVEFNRAAESSSGYSLKEIKGMNFWEVFLPKEFHLDARRNFAAIRVGSQLHEYEQRWLVRDGTWRDFLWSHSLMTDVNGNIQHIVGTGIDITEKRIAERELRASQEALNRAREREVEIGMRIQKTLLIPQTVDTIKGVQIKSQSLASQKIDGDFWDVFIYDSHRFDIIVGDVMGKGVPAALLAAASKSHFQRSVRRLGLSLKEYGRFPDPAEIVGAVHAVITPDLAHLDSFVTLCYGSFDLDNMKLELVDAGHVRTIHLHAATGEVDLLEGFNLPLGVSEWEVYSQLTVKFEPGDLFVFYSDGVTEARYSDGTLYGIERLIELVKSSQHLSANEIVERVVNVVLSNTDGENLSDDVTCLAIKIDEKTLERAIRQNRLEVYSDLAEISKIRNFVKEFCLASEPYIIDEDKMHALILATSEAVSNIMLHSYDKATDRRVQVEMEAFSDRICLTLCDWGRPFERGGVPSPNFDGSREGGFGIFIIENSVDEVRYYQDELGRNCLALTKIA